MEEVRAHLQQAQEELAQGAARDRGGAGGRSDRDGGRSDRDGGGAQAFAVESVQRRSDLHHIDAVAESFDMCAASCWSGIRRVQYVWISRSFRCASDLALYEALTARRHEHADACSERTAAPPLPPLHPWTSAHNNCSQQSPEI